MDFLTLFLILFTIFFVIGMIGAIQRRRRMNRLRGRYMNQNRLNSEPEIIIVQPGQPSYGYNQFQGGYYQQPYNAAPSYGGQPGQANYNYAQPYYHPPPPNNS